MNGRRSRPTPRGASSRSTRGRPTCRRFDSVRATNQVAAERALGCMRHIRLFVLWSLVGCSNGMTASAGDAGADAGAPACPFPSGQNLPLAPGAGPDAPCPPSMFTAMDLEYTSTPTPERLTLYRPKNATGPFATVVWI